MRRLESIAFLWPRGAIEIGELVGPLVNNLDGRVQSVVEQLRRQRFDETLRRRGSHSVEPLDIMVVKIGNTTAWKFRISCEIKGLIDAAIP